jgi:hypothetical protein
VGEESVEGIITIGIMLATVVCRIWRTRQTKALVVAAEAAPNSIARVK